MLAAPFLMKLKTLILNANNFFLLERLFHIKIVTFWNSPLNINELLSDFFFLSFPSPCLKNERKPPTKAMSEKMKLVQKWWYLILFFVCLSYFSGQEQYLLFAWHPAQMGPMWLWAPMLLEDTVIVSWLCKFTTVMYWSHCCHHM